MSAFKIKRPPNKPTFNKTTNSTTGLPKVEKGKGYFTDANSNRGIIAGVRRSDLEGVLSGSTGILKNSGKPLQDNYSDEVGESLGTYGQNVWGDVKASGTVEGLGIGEGADSEGVDTGRRKRRSTKTSSGLGI